MLCGIRKGVNELLASNDISLTIGQISTKLHRNVPLMVLFQIVQRSNALLKKTFIDKLFLSHSLQFHLHSFLIKYSQTFTVKYLLLIYYHSGDRFRAIFALLFKSREPEVLMVSYCDHSLRSFNVCRSFSVFFSETAGLISAPLQKMATRAKSRILL